MLVNFSYVLIGISLLVWSADKLTDGAAAIARNFGVPPFVVGLTIVAIGSSAPEMVISTVASIGGSSGLAIGNALGSNIVNIAVVLPIAAFICPLLIRSEILRVEMPLMLIFTGIASYFLWDGYLAQTEGMILIILVMVHIIWLTLSGFRHKKSERLLVDIVEELPEQMPTARATFWVIVGLIVLILSSDLLIGGATGIARQMGISETVIGLTIVAIGTSLPELAASIAAALKKEHEMVLGNIIGSNIFNILAVLGIAGTIMPVHIESSILARDLPTMVAFTVGMYLLSHGYGKEARIGRPEAAILLVGYVVYSIVLYQQM